MAEVIWSGEAVAQLELIRTYIYVFDPKAADRIAADLLAAGNSLDAFPRRAEVADDGLHELGTVRPYLIRYYVEDGGRVVIADIKQNRRGG